MISYMYFYRMMEMPETNILAAFQAEVHFHAVPSSCDLFLVCNIV